MKSSTSWPSWSRKYSATVRPVRATRARGLVHLSVHQGDLGGLVLEGDDTTLNHLVVQIVALPGPLADTSEHRETTVSLGNVVDQLHD